MDNLKEMIEALLFASGKAMSLEQISLITNYQSSKVKKALAKLKDEYEARKGALMVLEEDDAWKLTVREGYLPLVRKIVADTELPKTVIETLAVIAWRSPTTQSDVIKIRTNKAYEHISELERLGFVVKEKDGRTYKLKLTEKFFEYFDVSGNKDIRDMFKNVRHTDVEKETSEDEPASKGEKTAEDENTSEGSEHPEEETKKEKEEGFKDVDDVVQEIDKEEKEKEYIEKEVGVIKPENNGSQENSEDGSDKEENIPEEEDKKDSQKE